MKRNVERLRKAFSLWFILERSKSLTLKSIDIDIEHIRKPPSQGAIEVLDYWGALWVTWPATRCTYYMIRKATSPSNKRSETGFAFQPFSRYALAVNVQESFCTVIRLIRLKNHRRCRTDIRILFKGKLRETELFFFKFNVKNFSCVNTARSGWYHLYRYVPKVCINTVTSQTDKFNYTSRILMTANVYLCRSTRKDSNKMWSESVLRVTMVSFQVP